MSAASTSIGAHFGHLVDPRIHRTRLHSLHEILVITICAAVCGADNWVHIEMFAKAKEQWFRTFMDLPHGIPSHDTLGRVFSALDPESFGKCFASWAAAVANVCDGEVIAIDGKTARRSFDTASSKSAVHMVNAWATRAGLALGQIASDAKSNEITAIPKLLDLLSLKGCIVTTDAMGCQTAIVEKVIDKGADYVLALKGNQGTLFEETQKYFAWAEKGGPDVPESELVETVDGDHGRIETRRYHTIGDVAWCSPSWKGLKTLTKVTAERTSGKTTSTETRYYISSLGLDRAASIAQAIRSHWGVENSLHWVLDVAFNEDQSRVRSGNAPANLAIVRQIALNLLKQNTSVKAGIAGKRLLAGWNNNFLLNVLGI